MYKPNCYSYGEYSSGNYGARCMCFEDVFGNKYWYSYETLVAFHINGEFHIIKNYWGPTTGKHLNWIDNDKAAREDADTFHANLKRLSETSAD